MARHSAMPTLDGHPLTTSLCPSVTMHTFSPHHLYQVSRWQSLTAAGSKEEAGEDFGPTPPFSPSDSHPLSPTFTQEQFEFFQEENWVCGLGQPELRLILRGILPHGVEA